MFNGDKFELVRYSASRNPIEHTYKTLEGKNIIPKDKVTDLGVTMSSSARFDEQISDVAARSRQKMGWIFRVFHTRQQQPMMTLFRSLVLPLLEYCCQLWNPGATGMMRKLEAVQRTFTCRIDGMAGLNYWQRLQRLKLYSLQRRRERYIVIYIWKILNDQVPNFDGVMKVQSRINERRGTLCTIPPNRVQATHRVQTLRENSLAVNGPRLFNCLPAKVRNYEGTLETFKRELDNCLSRIPDEPSMPNYPHLTGNNSIVAQIVRTM